MVYGELGKCCITDSVKERMVIFWSRLVTSKQSKISYIMYRVVKLLHDRDDIPFQSDWIGNVKNILCEYMVLLLFGYNKKQLILNG